MRTKCLLKQGKLRPVSLKSEFVFQPQFSNFGWLPGFQETWAPPPALQRLFLHRQSLAVRQLPSPLSISWSLATQHTLPSLVVPLLPQLHQLLQMSPPPTHHSLPKTMQYIHDSREQGLLTWDLHTAALNILHGRAKDFIHLAVPFNFLLTGLLFLCYLKTFSNSCCCSQLFWLFPLTRMLNLSTLQSV